MFTGSDVLFIHSYTHSFISLSEQLFEVLSVVLGQCLALGSKNQQLRIQPGEGPVSRERHKTKQALGQAGGTRGCRGVQTCLRLWGWSCALPGTD